MTLPSPLPFSGSICSSSLSYLDLPINRQSLLLPFPFFPLPDCICRLFLFFPMSLGYTCCLSSIITHPPHPLPIWLHLPIIPFLSSSSTYHLETSVSPLTSVSWLSFLYILNLDAKAQFEMSTIPLSPQVLLDLLCSSCLVFLQVPA